MDNLEISEYKPEDIDNIAALLKTHMGFKRLDIAFWSWKFNRGGISGKPLGIALRISDKVVGFCSFFPCIFTANSEQLLGWLAADVVIHQSYRRRGFFIKMYSAALDMLENENCDFTFCFPTKEAHLGYKKMLYRNIGTIPYFLLIPDYISLIKKKIPWFPQKLELTKSKCKVFSEKHDNDYSISITKQNSFPADFRISYSQQKKLIMINRNQEYLNWRYVNHPWHKYDIFIASKGNIYTGYIVLRDCNIVDMFSLDTMSFRSLLKTSLDYFLENKIPVAHAYIQTSTQQRKVLREAGFRSYIFKKSFLGAYNQQTMLLRSNRNNPFPEQFYDKTNWYLTTGDIALGL